MSQDSMEEIQREVLGTFLRFPERLSAGNLQVRPNMFARRSYATLCECLQDMTAQGLPVEDVTVWDYLEAKFQNHGIDGLAEIVEINNSGNASGQIRYHLERLEEDYHTRALRQAAAQILSKTEGPHDPREVLAQFEKSASQSFALSSAGFRPFHDGMMESLDRIEKAFRGEIPLGIPTGFSGLDALCGGWQPGDLIPLGGRPGMGKSAFLINTMLHAARLGKHAAMMSMEMTEFDINCRAFGATDTRLVPAALRQGKLTAAGWVRLTEAATSLGTMPMSVFDKPGITVAELIRAVRALHVRHPVDLLTVDYLQLMESEERYVTRERAITETSKALKRLAKELKIPVLAACSLNRECEKRPDKRPVLSDLRESGNIESDADLVIFLYREEIYDRDTMDKGICEILVKKNRHGPTGEVRVRFDGPSMTFA